MLAPRIARSTRITICGVRAGHYRVMGESLMAALGAALGPAWTDELAEAWSLAYDLVAETMLQGALLSPPADPS